MNSNEHSSPFRHQPPKRPWQHQLPSRPHAQEDTLKSEGIQIERKAFVFLLKENPRGRFLRIIEQGGKNSASIIVPSAGLNEFKKLLDDMLKAVDAIPSKPHNP